jgi:hypothetical protein
MSFRMLMILVAMGFLMPTDAQQDTGSSQPGTEQQSDQTDAMPEQGSEADSQDAAPAAQTELPDFENEPIQRVEGQAPGRFIPSEQISQDLGVSFPTDI